MESLDLGLLVLRVAVGAVMVMHGYQHLFRGGRIAGTARWFESLGMRPGRLHAWTASLAELAAGLALVLGLGTPIAAAAVIGLMLVAFVVNHARNGFFIFNPGEGYEYVLTLVAAGIALAGTGPGSVSLDHAMGWFEPGRSWFLVAITLGVGATAALLAACWRPQREDSPVSDDAETEHAHG